jgi:hypothetical protein
MELGGIAKEIFGDHRGPNFPPSALNRTLHALLAAAGPGPVAAAPPANGHALVRKPGGSSPGVA